MSPSRQQPVDTSAVVLQSLRNEVFCLKLNRAKSGNALSCDMLAELQIHLDNAVTLAKDGNARAIIISANSPIFCAGHDLKEISAARKNEDLGLKFFENLMQSCSQVMQTIVNHPLPVIADVRGIASAAGCQLVASCDLAFASSEAQFSTPGVNIGLFCSTPMVALSRNIHRKHAMEMLLSGDLVDAEHAKNIGLINRVIDTQKMDGEIEKFVRKLMSKSAKIVSFGKKAFYQQVEMDLAKAYEYTSQVMVENMMARDAKEGIEAFIDKREPEWRD